ncbi:MAG TPA: heme-binding protein, partial [Tepidisphaeraceae bacterium]|nr:heme-binding protein [Tepidisphaeraceae bacterium]
MHKPLIEQLETRQLLSAVAPGTLVDLPLQPATGENVALAPAQVQQILAQAISQGLNKTGQTTEVAVVVDREGQILGTLAGNGTPSATTQILLALAAVRARTASNFQSDGEAFTTRTARFIVQNHFPPGIANTEGGPLYGTQYSDLIGSDILLASQTPGISGDPGGVPLYTTNPATGKKVAVGAIGVAGDFHDTAATLKLLPLTQEPGYNANPKGRVYHGQEEVDRDEAIAQAGANGFMAPAAIRATNIFIGGLRLPFVAEPPASGKPSIAFQTLTSDGSATEYTAAGAAVANNTTAVIAGTPEMMNASIGGVQGLIRDRANVVMSSVPGVPTLDANGNEIPHVDPQADGDDSSPLFDNIISSDDTGGLTQQDVVTIIGQAVQQAEVTRAGIRKPNGINAEVHVVVVDTAGNVLGAFRMNDGTNFSYDIAVQKARTAAFFSDDTHAFSTRAIGFMAQRNFPPGLGSQAEGPLFGLQNALNESAPPLGL